MIRRRLGRTGRDISVAVLGGAAFASVDVETCAATFALAARAGVDTLDVAPSYGGALAVVGEVLPSYRERFYVACKTLARDRDGARRELEASLAALRTDRLDLFQLHAVTSDDELAAVLAPGGAADALVEARQEGLVGAIGITGHFAEVPRLFSKALDVVDLDTVMLPVNAPMLRLPTYRRELDALLDVVVERDLGVLAIKAVAKGWWRRSPTYTTWYEPHDVPGDVQRCVDLVLSLPVSGFALPGDVRLLPAVLDAVKRFTPMTDTEIDVAVGSTPDLALVGAHP